MLILAVHNDELKKIYITQVKRTGVVELRENIMFMSYIVMHITWKMKTGWKMNLGQGRFSEFHEFSYKKFRVCCP